MITSGFFNSVDGDRKYYADEINSFFEGLVGKGVFQRVGGGMCVHKNGNMQIYVDTGKLTDSRGRWMKNDAKYVLTVDRADVAQPRIDAVIACIDSSGEERKGKIYIKKGIPSPSPSKPKIERSRNKEEYCLAYITITPKATYILQSNIQDARADSIVCGFVSVLIDQPDAAELFLQYDSVFNEWFSVVKEKFKTVIPVRSYQSKYNTGNLEMDVIPIHIPQYNKELDILHVYINGMKLIQDEEYKINSNSYIKLTKSVDRYTEISFEVLKSVDGSGIISPLLYQSETGTIQTQGQEIVPLKPLSECQHGWILTFSGYDLTNNEAKDEYVQTAYVPKTSYKNAAWNGESMTFSLVYECGNGDNTDVLRCVKSFAVYDGKMVNGQNNHAGVARNVVLRSVQEF